MAESLKRKTGLALFWSFVDKGGQQIIQFVFVYILARLVLKEDFGLIAVLAIFTAIANILQESGFSSALIRKKNVKQTEFTSVFYFNISASIIIYLLFFLGAPFISSFYGRPVLTDLSRFIFLAFVFNAFGIVQNVHLIKSLNFKINTRITLLAGIISGLAAIVLAYNGFGVWSLAAQQVIQSFLRCIFLWIFVKWRPDSRFRFVHIREMSSFSLKLLATSLLNQICANIFPLIIGKNFSFSQVASFGQGMKLNTIPLSVISEGVKSVAYPLLSNIEQNSERGKKIYRKIIRMTAFISFPVSMLLIVLAKPIVSIYLPKEWMDVIPILQILSIGLAFYPLYVQISSLLQYKGKSGLLLKIDILRNILLLSSIFVTFKYGVLGLVMGISMINILSFFVGMHFAGKTICYSMNEVIKDITPYLTLSAFCILPFLFIFLLGINNIYLLLIIPLIAGSFLYLLILKILGSAVISDTLEFIKHSLKRK